MHKGGKDAFQLQLVRHGVVIPSSVSATPTLLTISGEGAAVKIAFEGPDHLRIHGEGAALSLTTDSGWVVPYGHGMLEVNTNAMKYMVMPIAADVDATTSSKEDGSKVPAVMIQPHGSSNLFDAELDAYTSGWNKHQVSESFDSVVQRDKQEYSKWLKTMPSVGEQFRPGAELAAYVNWESVVAPSGNLHRPAMLMSKNWMESVWSWDHAFNAMALSMSNSQLAWDQFLLPFDVQNDQGALPDKWDADAIEWEYSKPPIHGWALSWLSQNGKLPDSRLSAELYARVSKWTDWYFHYRDDDGNGIPEYRHGNEAGWDNTTIFDGGGPVESPDLSAMLVVQMDTLSALARRLKRPAEARQWKRRADDLTVAMLKRFWRDDHFIAIRVRDQSVIQSQSLVLDVPIILGARLPNRVRTHLVADIRRRAQQSALGLASEPVGSPFYQSDGYWRGPIWAPTTMMITAALARIGEKDLSQILERRFCEMAQRSGMSENFEARTGDGLRDPAYTWTSSVYLILAHDLTTKGSQ